MLSNKLVLSKYHLTMDEKKLVLMAFRQISSVKKTQKEMLYAEIEEFRKFRINLKETHQLSGEKISYKNFSDRVHRNVKDLFERKIILDDSNPKKIIWIRWISKISWITGSNFIEISLSTELMKLLLDNETGFTALQLDTVLSLKKAHSIRLYELLLQYEDFKNRSISMHDLRTILDYENKYERTAQFMQRRVETAVEDINTNSNIKITNVEKIKDGKTITDIKFNFKVLKGTSNKERINNAK